jgi:hypothetical protein
MTEEARRAAIRAENIGSHLEILKSILQTAQNPMQALFAENDAGRQGQGAQLDLLENRATECDTVSGPVSEAERVYAKRDMRLQGEEDLIAAATALIRAAARCRSRDLQAAPRPGSGYSVGDS